MRPGLDDRPSDACASGRNSLPWLAAFVGYASFGATLQVFPPFLDALRSDLGVGRFEAGLTITAFLAPVAVLAATVGRAVDQHGGVRIARSGFAILVIGGLATAVMPTLVTLLVARAIAGIGGGMVLIAVLKLLTAGVAESRLCAALGVFVAGFPVGTAIAFDVLAPLARSHGGWRLSAIGAVIVSATGFAVFSALTTARTHERPASSTHVIRAPLPNNPDLRRLLALVVVGYAAIVAFTTWAPIRLASYAHLGHQTAVLIASVLLIIDIPFAPFWGRVSDRSRRRKPFVIAAFAVYGGRRSCRAHAHAPAGGTDRHPGRNRDHHGDWLRNVLSSQLGSGSVACVG